MDWRNILIVFSLLTSLALCQDLPDIFSGLFYSNLGSRVLTNPVYPGNSNSFTFNLPFGEGAILRPFSYQYAICKISLN